LLHALEQKFTPVEARRKLNTAIRWGRYAGLFTYDDDRGEFQAVSAPAGEARTATRP
jgi:hypothetical protein